MAIESRFRTRGGYSHVTPYSRQQSNNGRVVSHKPPAPRVGVGRQAPTVSYAYVAAQRGQSLKASGNHPCPPQTNLGAPPMMPPCSQVQGIQAACAPMTQFNAGANLTFVAMPMTLPPPICNQAGLPQFGRLYEEFDRMKRNGFVVQPRPLQTPTPPLPPPATTMAPPAQSAAPVAGAEFVAPRPLSRVPSPVPPPMGQPQQQGQGQGVFPAGEGVFTTAMKLFMHSYMPTACFDCTVPVDDWGREAQALIAEVMTVGCAGRGQPARTHKSSWPESGSRNASSDYDVTNSSSSSGPSPDKGVAPGWLGDPLQRMDIHRHILEIKPSPYPGGSPLSVPSLASGHSSDNDADDESAASCNSSPASLAPRVSGNSTVRRPSYKKKHDSARVRLSMDSGYQSSSTDGGSSCHGSQASACCLDSDGFSSDIGSSCGSYSSSSSRPSSPTRGRDEPQFLSPTEVPPYLNALLEAPWIEKKAPRKALPTPTPQLKVSHPVSGFEKPQGQPTAVPEGAYTYHKHKEWITDEILEMIVVRDRLYKRMKKHPAPDIVDMYKKVRNMVVGMTRNAKRAHEKRIEDMRSGAPSAGGYNNNNVYHYVAPKYRRLSSGSRRTK